MRDVDQLYARIPKVSGCRPNCSDCCGPVPMTAGEAGAIGSPIRPEMLGEFRITPTKMCGTCAYSTPDGCSVYSARPFMCRLFGAVEGEPRLQCPNGAKADRPLTSTQAAELTAEYHRLMSGPTA